MSWYLWFGAAGGLWLLLTLLLRRLDRWMPAFAVLNLAAVALGAFWDPRRPTDIDRLPIFAATVTLIALHRPLLLRFARSELWLLPFGWPLLLLVASRYGRFLLPDHAPWLMVLGLSYIAFRLSLMTVEIRNRPLPFPSWSEHLAFTFFLPTFLVGPISPWQRFVESTTSSSPTGEVAPRALLRILVGTVKLVVLGGVLRTLTFTGLFSDGAMHPPIDVLIASVAFYLHLYCDFSGLCDIVIGLSALAGFDIAENFDSPFAARNLRDFWNRWHITLSDWMKDIVFTPLSLALIRRFGVRNADHAMAAATFIVFLLIGIWHGAGWNFVLLGVVHGAGCTLVHYFDLALRRLGRERRRRWLESSLAATFSRTLTFFTVALSLMLFENDIHALREILSRTAW